MALDGFGEERVARETATELYDVNLRDYPYNIFAVILTTMLVEI